MPDRARRRPRKPDWPRWVRPDGSVILPGRRLWIPWKKIAGKRYRAKTGAVELSVEVCGNQEKRSRVGDLHLAFVADKEVAEEHA